jgi:hypothetical protein
MAARIAGVGLVTVSLRTSMNVVGEGTVLSAGTAVSVAMSLLFIVEGDVE